MGKKINKIKVVTEATKFTSSFGVAYMASNAMTALVPPQAKIPVKVCCYIGTTGVAGALNMKVNEYWDELGEAIEGTIWLTKEAIKESKKEVKKKVTTEEKPKKKETKKKSQKKPKLEVIETTEE